MTKDCNNEKINPFPGIILIVYILMVITVVICTVLKTSLSLGIYVSIAVCMTSTVILMLAIEVVSRCKKDHS